jgi:hypothetical protein
MTSNWFLPHQRQPSFGRADRHHPQAIDRLSAVQRLADFTARASAQRTLFMM